MAASNSIAPIPTKTAIVTIRDTESILKRSVPFGKLPSVAGQCRPTGGAHPGRIAHRPAVKAWCAACRF
jgi:hypothetical protein